ncbi:hypothetical protein LTR62_003701 [Meristemomyces frigidus]|uniref:Cell wall protein n=1 Tax=Meristemomyces frigidus TaxID=1508187 RepID=A0AAN7TIY3_9PEZI|nr:hypothetical protein LTR62_003701 [Meristemomyces frigidus]
MSILSLLLLPASLATLALARTDLSGCTSTDVSSPAGASLAWYVPGTGELCNFLDCGGGTAPPKTDVPGCPLYSGTASYSPSFMPGWGSGAAATTTMAAASSSATSWSESTAVPTSTSASWSALETDSSSSVWDLYTTAPSSSWTTSMASVSVPTTTTWSTSNSSAFVSTTTAVVATPVVVASNGTMATGTGSSGVSNGNGTSGVTTAKPNATQSGVPVTGGAAESAQAWVGATLLGVFGVVVLAL